MTLVRNEHDVLPLASVGAVVPGGRGGAPHVSRRHAHDRFVSPVRAEIADRDRRCIDERGGACRRCGRHSKCSAIVVAAFATVAANRGNVGLSGDLTPFIAKLTEGPVPVAIVAMGNPYLLSAFPKTAAYLATFSITPPSESRR